MFKYLRGTLDYSICYKGFPCVVEGYSDANWITDSSDVKSTLGYVFLLGEEWLYPGHPRNKQ